MTNNAVWIEPWEELDVEAGIEIRRRRILLYVGENSGVARRALETGAGGYSRSVRDDIYALVTRGLIRVEDGPRNFKLHFLTDAGAAAATSWLAAAAAGDSVAATGPRMWNMRPRCRISRHSLTFAAVASEMPSLRCAICNRPAYDRDMTMAVMRQRAISMKGLGQRKESVGIQGWMSTPVQLTGEGR